MGWTPTSQKHLGPRQNQKAYDKYWVNQNKILLDQCQQTLEGLSLKLNIWLFSTENHHHQFSKK